MNRCANIRSNFARRVRRFGHDVVFLPQRRTELFPTAALQRIRGGDRAASSRPAPGIASRHFRRRRTFSRKKYRCKKSTLQLSSYVVESGVFSHHEASFYAGFCRV
ncbi:hypothetical protein [Burkholderia sp. MSMB1078WGS]|uniref:hypothetical protein n=1 Tax=Burkholderia sp. MSMB1078WGS TaxID=1637900 RepID=UPI000A829C66|nr:hypothetical protein [Burkholderia sp. MSMB1078WGS]